MTMLEKSASKTIQVKVCGITQLVDAMACVEAGVDALGFVFYPKSPRNRSIKQAREIIRQIPAHVAKVGVFVNEAFASVMEKVENCGLTAVQLHGQEPPELVAQLVNERITVIKALFAKTVPGFEAAKDYLPSAFLVECGKGALPGGNAMQWDWAQAKGVARNKPLILAGGLSDKNVAEAIMKAMPDAVDVSSGVEISPGIKDVEKIKKFMDSIPKTPQIRPVF